MREAIEKIKAAEGEAEQIEAMARQEADNAMTKAGEYGEKYIEDAVSQANAAAFALIEDARHQAAGEFRKMMKKAGEEAQQIMDIPSEKMEAAVLKIVEGIMNGI